MGGKTWVWLAVGALVALASAREPIRWLDQDVIRPPERLVYELSWGWFTIGEAEFRLTASDTVSGIPEWRLVTLFRTTGFAKRFADLRDTSVSILDNRSLLASSVRHFLTVDTPRGNLTVHIRNDIDQWTGEIHHATFATTEDTIIIETSDTTVVPPIQGMMGALYEIRTLNLVISDTVRIKVSDARTTKLLPVAVVARETKKVDAGRFDCVKVVVITKTSSVTHSKGNIEVWLSDDDRRLPVFARIKTRLGSVKAELVPVSYDSLEDIYIRTPIPVPMDVGVVPTTHTDQMQ